MNAVARFRESLTLALIALLPLHAMAVTVLTQTFQGSNHAPLLMISIWKEAVLALLVLIAVAEIMTSRESDGQSRVWSMDPLDWCIVLAVVVGALGSIDSAGSGSFLSTHLSLADRKFLVGFKYDFLPLVVFFFLRRVPWTRDFYRSAAWVLIGTGVLVAIFGLITLWLPMSFFTVLGYSDLHSLYRPNAPIAAFQMVEGTTLRRIQSVMSGPNQFGLWLLIPLAAALQWCVESIARRRFVIAIFAVATSILFLITIALTYSRSAWIASALMIVLLLFWILRGILQKVAHRIAVVVVLAVIAAAVALGGIHYAPAIVVRTQSLLGHFEKPKQAITLLRAHPLGMGLGSAGPASNHYSDTCVFLPLGADFSWAKQRPDLCVFLGGVRKLPAGKVCECPLLTENWYLQWGVEMGYVGFLLSLLIVFLPLVSVRRISPLTSRSFPLLALAGIGVAGLFLHSFEDSAVAYTIWILVAAIGLRIPDADYVEATSRSGTLRP